MGYLIYKTLHERDRITFNYLVYFVFIQRFCFVLHFLQNEGEIEITSFHSFSNFWRFRDLSRWKHHSLLVIQTESNMEPYFFKYLLNKQDNIYDFSQVIWYSIFVDLYFNFSNLYKTSYIFLELMNEFMIKNMNILNLVWKICRT